MTPCSAVTPRMNTFMRTSLAMLSATLVCASAASRADVVPDGQRYIAASNDLTGTATLAGRTLLLVTLNDRVRGVVSVVPKVGDGPLTVPGGYRNQSYLVALTPAELAELDKVRGGSWSYEPSTEREEPGAFRKFFDQKGLVSSDALPFKYLVARGTPAQSARLHWTITGVAGEAIQMSVAVEELDQSGAPLTGASILPFALAGGGAVLVLGVAVFFLMRRRARHLPQASKTA